MPHIIPIKELKNTGHISDICHTANGPVFITKNGYGDMVIMSMETYESTMFINDVYRKIEEAEESVKNGEVIDAFSSLQRIREKYKRE